MSDQNSPAAQVPEAAPAGPAPEATVPAQHTVGATPGAPAGIPAQSVQSESAPVPAEPAEAAAAPIYVPETSEPATKPRKGRLGTFLTFGVLIVLILGVGGYFLLSMRNNPDKANVGDCLSGTEDPGNADDIKLVDCTDPKASFKVLKKIDNQLKPASTDQTACDGTATTDTFWFGRDGKPGTILCLSKLNA